MTYFYYSTWILKEHLRLWEALSLYGWLGWLPVNLGPSGGSSAVSFDGPPDSPVDRRPALPSPPESYFERLVAATERLAHHAAYPGKQQAVEQGVEDVEHLIEVGRITVEQGEVLRTILSGSCLPAA